MPVRRRWIVSASFVLALASLAPVSIGPAPAVQAQEPSIREVPGAIQSLLGDRGRSWTSKDRGLLESTLVPGDFARSQLTAFDHASELRFAVYGVQASTRFSGDLTWPRVAARYPDKEVLAFHVVESVAIAGVEEEPFIQSGYYTFVRTSPERGDRYEGWRHASDSDFEPLGAFSPAPLWAAAPVVSVASEHFLLLAHPDRIDQVRELVTMAEQAYGQARSFWPRPVDDRYVIVVPSTSTELGRMIQATVDLTKFVAFAARTTRLEGDFAPAGVRIFIHLDRFIRYDDAGRQGILTHELIHALTTPVSGPFVPVWVEEGLAMHGSEPESGVRTARRGPTPDEFPTSDLFYVGGVSDIVRTYARSQVAFEVLEDIRGREAAALLYESLGGVRTAPGTPEYQVRRVVSESLGWSVDEWTKAWRDRL